MAGFGNRLNCDSGAAHPAGPNGAAALIFVTILCRKYGAVGPLRNYAAALGDCAPHFESVARKCDISATFLMPHAHGFHAAPGLVFAANLAYGADNNKKKRETPWIIGPPKGDDTMAYAPSTFAPRELAFTRTRKNPSRPGAARCAGCTTP